MKYEDIITKYTKITPNEFPTPNISPMKKKGIDKGIENIGSDRIQIFFAITSEWFVYAPVNRK